MKILDGTKELDFTHWYVTKLCWIDEFFSNFIIIPDLEYADDNILITKLSNFIFSDNYIH